MLDLVTYMYMYLHKWLSINGYVGETFEKIRCCCLWQISYSCVEVISLVSLALQAILVRFSGSILSVACHSKSVILSGLTVSVHLWPMPVVSGISCTMCSKGITCFTSETCLTDNLPWLSQTSTLAFPVFWWHDSLYLDLNCSLAWSLMRTASRMFNWGWGMCLWIWSFM